MANECCYLELHHRAEDVCAPKAGQTTAALVNIQHTDEKQKMATVNINILGISEKMDWNE